MHYTSSMRFSVCLFAQCPLLARKWKTKRSNLKMLPTTGATHTPKVFGSRSLGGGKGEGRISRIVLSQATRRIPLIWCSMLYSTVTILAPCRQTQKPERWGQRNYGFFAPKTIRSRERKFQVWNFRSLELSHRWPFAPSHNVCVLNGINNRNIWLQMLRILCYLKKIYRHLKFAVYLLN